MAEAERVGVADMRRGRAEDRLFRNHRICQDLPGTWVTPSPYIVFTS